MSYYQRSPEGDCLLQPTERPTDEDFEYEVLTELNNVFPMGYPTEQYMCFVKNDVHKAFTRLKEEKK